MLWVGNIKNLEALAPGTGELFLSLLILSVRHHWVKLYITAHMQTRGHLDIGC